MDNRDCYNQELDFPTHTAAEAEEIEHAFITGLLSQGYELVVNSPLHWVFKKDDITISIFYNPKNPDYELSVVPAAAGPVIYRWLLDNTPLISSIRWHLTVFPFWQGKNLGNLLDFIGNPKQVLQALLAAGYTYLPDHRTVVQSQHVGVIQLTRGEGDAALHITLAFETHQPVRIYHGPHQRRIWISTPRRDSILEVASILHHASLG